MTHTVFEAYANRLTPDIDDATGKAYTRDLFGSDN